MIPAATGGGAAFLVLTWVLLTLNWFVRLRNLVRESSSDLDVALQRRHDLIPNLVETAKGYAAYEQATLQKVIDARNNAISQARSLPLQAMSEAVLTQALTGLFARLERYPDLKASDHFMALQKELADTEDRIAAARRFYNANVRDYNIALRSFPGSMLASGRAPAEFFEASDREAAPVSAAL